MKRISATIAIVVLFVVALSGLSGTSSARISPIAQQSTPRSSLLQSVPYVNEYGETITGGEVITSPDGVPIVVWYQDLDVFPTPTPRPTLGPSPTPGNYKAYLPMIYNPAYTNADVLVIAYEGKTPEYDPAELTAQLIADIKNATRWHGYSITTTLPSISFNLVDGAVDVVPSYPPTRADGYYDLDAIYQAFDICARVQRGEVDEVWIFSDGDQGHMYSDVEFVARAPTWQAGGAVTAPYCGKQVYTMLYNFKVPAYYAMHSWSHSAEFSWLLFASSGYEACDFPSATNYGDWSGTQQQCTGAHAYSDQYAFSTRPAAANNYVANCGGNHLPTNIPASILSYDPTRPPQSRWIYIWDSPNVYGNRCNDWQWGTITSTQTISCTLWGCGQAQWHIYHLQNTPGLNNNSHGRSGALRPNWWNFRMPTSQ
jgi:hypothetical protein